MLGAHLVKHCSKAQQDIALSSGEAELYAATKGAIDALGVQNALLDLGCDHLPVSLCIDAAATKSAITRKGVGRMKHIEIQYLWIQQVVHQGKVACRKIPRRENAADALTHPWTLKDGPAHFQYMGLYDPLCLD